MVRTQIQLTEEQSERLRAASARQGVSISELVRQGVDAILERSGERGAEEIYKRAVQAAGRHRSGSKDVSIRHDEYLADSYRK